jgi:hypothetical protein
MCAFVYNIRRLVTLTTWYTSNIQKSRNYEFSICQWTIKIKQSNE